jgi:hypothetical protein
MSEGGYSQFRRYGGFPPLVRNQDVPGAHRHDPRARGAAFDPSAHVEQHQLAALRARSDASYEPMESTLDRLDPLNIPPQLSQTPFLLIIRPQDTPRKPLLLIPANTRRMSWSIAGIDPSGGGGPPNVTLFYSFGFPSLTAQALWGLPASGIVGESNGSVSIDDIFVFTSTHLAGGTLTILGYEGTLALYGRHTLHGVNP